MAWHPLFSLKFRIAATIFALEAVMMVLVLGETLYSSRQATRLQLAGNEQAILDMFADLSQTSLFTKEFVDLQQYAETLTADPHIVEVLVGDRDGRIVVSSDYSRLGKPVPVRFTDTAERFWRTKAIGNLGVIAIEFSNRELIAATWRVTHRSVTIALGAMVVIAIAGIGFGYLLTRRLKRVSDAAGRLAAGNFAERTGLTGRDEVSVVGRTFDHMAEQIERDISALEEQRGALIRARDDLEARVAERTAELKAASEAKSDFLATMSHEMRTPLNGVVGAAEMLADEDLPRRSRQLVDWLLVSSGQLRSLIDNLLDLRKIEAGKVLIEPSPFDLRVLMNRLAALFEPQAMRAGLRFTKSISATAPGMLIGDEARIRQILINLTANALKFTREGSVRVSVAAQDESDREVTLRFEVRDTGIGISEENAGRIFDRFAQAHPGIHRQYGGSGLGTTICKHLVELMGGAIGFESRVGSGTTFWFTLPLSKLPVESCAEYSQGLTDDASSRPAAPVPGQRAPGPTGLHILVADDHHISRQIIAMALESGGHRVTCVEDGEGVLESCRDRRFDAIVLDMDMPGRTGLEVACAVRIREAESRDRRTPIIMLTADACVDLREDALDAGVDLFLSKPADSRTLLQGVSQVVSGAARTDVPDAASERTQGAQDWVDSAALHKLAALSGRADFLQHLTRRFAEDARQLVAEMEVAATCRDRVRLRRLTHGLKGAAMMVGATRLRDSAARIERIADSGSIPADMLDELKGALEATGSELAQM